MKFSYIHYYLQLCFQIMRQNFFSTEKTFYGKKYFKKIMVYVLFKSNGSIKEYMNEYLVTFEKKDD